MGSISRIERCSRLAAALSPLVEKYAGFHVGDRLTVRRAGAGADCDGPLGFYLSALHQQDGETYELAFAEGVFDPDATSREDLLQRLAIELPAAPTEEIAAAVRRAKLYPEDEASGDEIDESKAAADEIVSMPPERPVPRVRAVVRRDSHEEITLADVECERSEKVRTAHDLLPRLRAALTRWRDSFVSGLEAWAQSACDFNVGDLYAWLDDPQLLACLEAEGIAGLTIQVFCCTEEPRRDWTYDTLLMYPEPGGDAGADDE